MNWVRRLQGILWPFSRPRETCPFCKGAGYVWRVREARGGAYWKDEKCTNCAGRGWVFREKE